MFPLASAGNLSASAGNRLPIIVGILIVWGSVGYCRKCRIAHDADRTLPSWLTLKFSYADWWKAFAEGRRAATVRKEDQEEEKGERGRGPCSGTRRGEARRWVARACYEGVCEGCFTYCMHQCASNSHALMQTPCCGHGLMQVCLPCTPAEGGPPKPKPVNAEAIGVSGKRYEDEFEFEKQRIKVRWIQGGQTPMCGRLLPLSDPCLLK